MIVLDTNVLSELITARPDPEVVSWLETQAMDALFTTAISRGEMLYGACILPAGRHRDTLLHEVEAIFSADMAGRVLPYDSDAAGIHATIAAMDGVRGRPISQPDAMIAGIVASRGAVLATRNVRDFEGCGIDVVDPWD